MGIGIERPVGNNDLRIDTEPCGGFHHVTLMDADDVEALRDELNKVLATIEWEKRSCPR